MKSIVRFSLVLVLSGFGLLVTGCGGGEGRGEEGAGAVRVDGSSTVFPITEAVAEEFMKANPGVRVTVGVSGTGGGFGKFLRGETDVNNASRPIKPSEIELARQNSIGFIELPVAYDGIAVMVNPENDWVECLTVEELNRIWQPDSEVDSWNDIRPSFPDRPISLYGAGTDSGTYDYFTEAIVGEEGASRTDFSASEDDNVLVQGIAGDPGALGFFGLAYYEANQGQLKLVGVDDENPENGEGCVRPTNETVREGTYQPLSRPLLIYVREASAGDPAVEAFTHFYLENGGALAREVGYVGLTDEEYALARERFAQRVTGSLFEHGTQVGVTLEDLLQLQDAAAGDAAGVDTTAVVPE